jgi:hypothetical protein
VLVLLGLVVAISRSLCSRRRQHEPLMLNTIALCMSRSRTIAATMSLLLDAHAGDRPRDVQLLDLLGAFEDVVGPSDQSGQYRCVARSLVW